MSAIFISHSSKDSTVATELKGWLDQHGFRSMFLDFDPELGIPAGRNWEQELYRQLRACQAVIVLCSEHSMASDWCFVEITHARALGKLIFPLRIAPCTVRPPLTELQVIDAVTARESAYDRLLNGLRQAGLENVFAWDPRRPPYPGLMTFVEADAAVFFGREADIRAGLDALNRVRRFGGAQLVVYLGASGSGKSSLLRAGVLPRLKQNTETWLVAPPFRPLQRPIDEMAMALAQMRESEKAPDWSTIALALNAIADATDPSLAAAHLMRDLRQAAGGGTRTIVFTVDQFEESLVDSQEAARFLRVLAAVVNDPDRQAFVLATLRSDFFSSMQTHPSLRSIPFDTLSVGRLTVDGLAQVIEGPAQVSGLELETGLTQLLLADAETDDSLPLLAFTLRELWEHDGKQGRLSIATYRDTLGGLNGAVARAAESVLAARSLTPQEEEDLRAAFLAMVRLNEAGQYTRQAVRWSDLPSRSVPLLERFVAARLLVSSSEDKDHVVEVAHEALFRVWKRAKEWLDADRDNLRLREGLRQAAREWNEHGRPAELLVHRGSRLEAAEGLAQQPRFQLDAVQREYLKACIDVREAERAAEAHRAAAHRRRVRVTIASLSIGLVIVSGLGLWAWSERRQATDRLANLHWVNGVTERDQNDDPLKALHHFTQAFALAKDATDARNAHLAADLLSGNAELAAILQPPGGVSDAAFTTDATRIVTWNAAGTARVWDARTGAYREAPLHEGAAQKVFTSPRGTRVVLRFGDKSVEVRDSETARELVTAPPGSIDPVFSDNELRIALIDNGVVRVWDQSSSTPLASFAHGRGVLGAALSGQGERVLTWDDQGIARLWNVDSGERLGEIKHGPDIVAGVVSPDATRVVLWGKAGAMSVWQVGNEARIVLAASEPTNPDIARAVFLSGNKKILTWNYGGVGLARIWDADSGKELASLRHDAAIRSAALNRADSLVLTWSDDRTARLWEAASGKPRAAFRHDDEVRGAVFAPDETRVLTWSEDGTARIWDAVSGQPLSLPLSHGSAVVGAAFSPDGLWVLSWDERGARLWRQRPETERHVYTLAHPDRVLTAGFTSGDGEIVTLTRDGRLHRWTGAQENDAHLALSRKLVGASFDGSGERVVGWSSDQTIGVWNVRNAHDLVAPMHHERSDLGIQGVAFSPDGSRILSFGDDKTARIWDSGTGKLLAALRHPGGVTGMVQSHDQTQVLTWSTDRVVRLWNVADQQMVIALPAHEFGVAGAALTRDASRIITWDTNGTIRLWNARDAAAIMTLIEGAGVAVRGVVFSADESRILAWDERSVRIRDASGKGLPEDAIVWDGGDVYRAVFNRDESRVLTVGESGARLWNSRSGQPLTKLLTIPGTMQGVLLSSDERTLLAWGDTSVRAWNVATGETANGPAAVLGQQVRTGTRLGSVGQVELINAAEWQKLRERVPPPK